ncbi:hypothetical protein GCM10009775_30710 [Microbacterium aoyamense]|uniref:Restriction endonuclease n=1 Tax=Microbacterium aoyamense TaxID=344166 RepID=A0ABN2PXL8_9MICO
MPDASVSAPEDLTSKIASLRPRQRERVVQLVDALIEGAVSWINPESDFADQDWVNEFGDQLRLHHGGSAIPLTKDKFEYAMVNTFLDSGHSSRKLGNGNPGADIEVDGAFWSLKTEAAAAIKPDKIHVSKAMELGKGNWETEEDIAVLREKFLGHLTKYTRVFTLRCLSRTPADDSSVAYAYELVEIPHALLERAKDGRIEMRHNSRQNPKPAYCYVNAEDGTPGFELYFDGGTERKLQIKNLWKRHCIVHANWSFITAS